MVEASRDQGVMDLRRKALLTGRWRVKIGDDLFRDNEPGDPLPEEGASYGLPGSDHLAKTALAFAKDLMGGKEAELVDRLPHPTKPRSWYYLFTGTDAAGYASRTYVEVVH